MIIGFILLCLTIFTFAVDVLLPANIGNFIFIFLFMLISIAIILTFMWKKLEGGEKALSFLSLILPFNLFSFLSLGGVIASVSQEGIKSFDLYTEILMLVIIALWYSALSMGALFEAISYIFMVNTKSIHNRRFHFNIAITLTTLVGGYFYLIHVSESDLRDFLVMLGVLLSLWLSASSEMFKE